MSTLYTCFFIIIWMETISSVIGICIKPVPQSSMYVDSSDENFNTGQSAFFKCKNGYASGGGSGEIVCQSGGTWSAATLVCHPVPCPDLGTLDHGSKSTHERHFGIRVEFSCDTGYTRAGSAYATCDANGAWYYPSGAPQCNSVTCPNLSSPSGGSVSKSDGNNYRSKATFTCSGFGYFYSGSSERECRSDSTWSGNAGTCITGKCANPVVEHGDVNAQGTEHLDAAQVTCHAGATKVPADFETSSCRVTDGIGVWTPALPTCNNGCPEMAIGNGSVSAASHGESPSVSCLSGFSPSSATTTCNNGEFAPIPTCTKILVPCPSMGNMPNGNGPTSEVQDGATYTFSCSYGFKLEGQATVTCDSGVYQPPPPQCVPKLCQCPDVTNGELNCNTLSHGQSVNVECIVGHKSIHSTVQCDNGLMDPPNVACIIASCDSIAINRGSVSSTDTQVGAQVTITCEDNYEYSKESRILNCVDPGTWNPALGTCNEKGTFCPQPTLERGDVTYPDGTEIGKTAQITCQSGSTMDPPNISTSKCIAPGVWSPSFPICKASQQLPGYGIALIVIAVVVVLGAIIGLVYRFGGVKKKGVLS